MNIGFYSKRPELLSQMLEVSRELNDSAYLDLTLSEHNSAGELSKFLCNSSLELLFFDTDQIENLEAELDRFLPLIPQCDVILLSSSDKYAVFGYSIGAVGYLITPLDTEDFLEILIQQIRKKVQLAQAFLPVRLNGVWGNLKMSSIVSMESAGHNLIFHMQDGRQLKTAAGFKDYQTQLELNTDFIRCHKSYAVNMRYVKDWQLDSFTMLSGDCVNISRPYWHTVRTAYAGFLAESFPQASPDQDTLQKKASEKCPGGITR